VRFVVIGPGAVGGVVGGRMAQFGHDVVLVARGAHRSAIASRGLTVEWPEGSVTLPVPVVGSPAELTFGPDDVVMVAVKSQDTAGVVDALGAVAPPSTPVVCLQNGVANEVAFLRRFANVHGATVVAPTWHLEPGVVAVYTHDAGAVIDVGRWPGGVDSVSEGVAAAFRASGFESLARPDIPRWKYTKLLLNLTNPIDALCPRDEDFDRLARLARAEGEAVLAAAGIDHVSAAEDKARRGDILQIVPIGAEPRPGASTWQSLARGLPVEVDHLTGEIVLLSRLHGVPAPVNTMLQQATHDAVAHRTPPGSIPAADLLARVAGFLNF
jgi:2-dehydropantoate 2-reductase